MRKLPKTQFLHKVSYKKSVKDSSTGAEFIRMGWKGQKHSEYGISSRSVTTISIKGPSCFFWKIFWNFLSVQPGCPTAGEKIKRSSNITFMVITLRIGPFWIIFKKFSLYKIFWIIHWILRVVFAILAIFDLKFSQN